MAMLSRWLRTHTRRYLPRPLAKQHDASALARKKYHQRQGKGNHSQPVDEETALFLGDRTVSQPAWQPGAMVRLTVSGKARVFSG